VLYPKKKVEEAMARSCFLQSFDLLIDQKDLQLAHYLRFVLPFFFYKLSVNFFNHRELRPEGIK